MRRPESKRRVKPRDAVVLKVDDAFHRLFHDGRFDTGLEVIVEDDVVVGKDNSTHNITVRGTYLGDRRTRAFARIPETVQKPQTTSFAEQYAHILAGYLDRDIYETHREGDRLTVRARISRADIERAIERYLQKQYGSTLITAGQFMEFTGAPHYFCVRAGEEEAPVHQKRFGVKEVLDYSAEAFNRRDRQRARFRNHADPQRPTYREFWDTTVNREMNILEIYRRALAADKEEPVQTKLF